MIQTIENMARIALLELHMYYVYKAFEAEAIKIKCKNMDESINGDVLDDLIELSRKHASSEIKDVQHLCIFIDQRLIRMGIQKTSASVIHDEIEGNFLAFRGTGERHHLLSKFHAQSISDKEIDVEKWLKETIEEESIHEQALQDFAKKLNPSIIALEPKFFEEADYKKYLRACFIAMFNSGPGAKPIEIYRELALRDAPSSCLADTIYHLMRPAEGVYWSYCNPK